MYVEKKLAITVIILTTIINAFFCLHVGNDVIDKWLFDKTTVSFYFYPNGKVESKAEILKKIEKFSNEKHIEVAQYSFLNSSKIDVYSTMKDKYKEISRISKETLNREIKVHDFDEILDVGFKNLLYLDTQDKDIIQSLSKELKDDCKIYIINIGSENDKLLDNIFFQYIEINSLPIIFFFIFVFIAVISFYYLNKRKEYFIYKVWGYTNKQVYCILNSPLYKTLLLTIFFINLVIGVIVYKFKFYKILWAMLTLNIAIVLLLFLTSLILFCILLVIEKNKYLLQEKMVLYFIKILLILLVIFSFRNLVEQKMELNEKLKSLTLWEDTRNLFNLHETYSPIYDEDLAAEDIFNDKVLNIYKELSDLNKVFIIKTTNFERSGENITKKNEENIDYTYKINMKNKEDLYSPYGRNIVVDKNYLKRHPIKDTMGKNVINAIEDKENVLNILVPLKFKTYEDIIKSSFKEWFYFQKVEVANIYREAKSQNIIEGNVDGLKVNIIYIENGQRCFTYNQNSGDSQNTIKDSIITIYTGNIDNSFLTACLGNYIFIEACSDYSALKEVNAITQKYNAIELNSISSVYDQKGEEIRSTEESINICRLNIGILFLFLTVFVVIITYIFYKSFLSMIVIKSLYGYNFIGIYKKLILTNFIINVLALLLVVIIYKKITLYILFVIGGMSFLDYLISRIMNRYLLQKGEIQFIKGEK